MVSVLLFFFFNDTATTEIYTLSLHDALPIFTEAGFDPILHEIITCQAAADAGARIQVTGHAWPALMIGELVFTRAGVHVRAGSAHAVPGIADRSTLHWEYWRRHRTTSDGSFWWGHNSQWRTELRRDYITDRGHWRSFRAGRCAASPARSGTTAARVTSCWPTLPSGPQPARTPRSWRKRSSGRLA